MEKIIKPSHILVLLGIGSRTLEDMRTVFCPEDYPFSMEFWQQKNPKLWDHPDIDRSSVSMLLWDGKGLSVESALTEAWEQLVPFWDKIRTTCEKNTFEWGTSVEVWLDGNIQQIQFGISREILKQFPWGTECFAIFPLNRKGEGYNYGSEQILVEDSFQEPLIRVLITDPSGTKWPDFQERTQDLDVAVTDALEFWEQTQSLSQTVSMPLEMNIFIEPINLYRLGFYLESTTLQKLKKLCCRLDIRFSGELMEITE